MTPSARVLGLMKAAQEGEGEVHFVGVLGDWERGGIRDGSLRKISLKNSLTDRRISVPVIGSQKRGSPLHWSRMIEDRQYVDLRSPPRVMKPIEEQGTTFME